VLQASVPTPECDNCVRIQNGQFAVTSLASVDDVEVPELFTELRGTSYFLLCPAETRGRRIEQEEL
jgi:hypothetical protein